MNFIYDNYRFSVYGEVFIEDDHYLYCSPEPNGMYYPGLSCNEYRMHERANGKREYLRYDTSVCYSDYTDKLELAPYDIAREIVLLELQREIHYLAFPLFEIDFINNDVIPTAQAEKEMEEEELEYCGIYEQLHDIEFLLNDYFEIKYLDENEVFEEN